MAASETSKNGCSEPKRRRLSDNEDDKSPFLFGGVVKTLGRLNLEDNGERDWYDESVNYLHLHFPDWKDLKRTVIIPPAFPVPLKDVLPGHGDITEKRVYDLLEEFGKTYKEPMFVVHSHNFADLIDDKRKGYEGKKKWNKGEHDFVIIHRHYGFVFLQVKSSKSEEGKAFEKGKWQIRKDIDSMKTFLDEFFKDKAAPTNMERVLYNYPGFVVMPNCQPTTSIDDTGVFMNDLKDKESFKRWWDDKVATSNKRVISKELYEALLVRFVALRCSSAATSSQIDETHKQIVHLHTPEQLKGMLTAGAEQWWAGPAGSGKTVLLKQKVKELAREIFEQKTQKKILVVCFNKPLSLHLKKYFQNWFSKNYPDSRFTHMPIKVSTYDSFIKDWFEKFNMTDHPESNSREIIERRRREVESRFKTYELPITDKYQHIFIDEGQDFSGKEWLNVLHKCHKQGSTDFRCYFWVFFDSNQHVKLTENESILWLSNSNVFTLTKVLRNTENIFLLAKTCYSGTNRDEITLGHKEVGMNVVFDDSLNSSGSNGIQIVVEHIRQLQQETVKMIDIAILTKALGPSDELVCNLEEENPPIRCYDAAKYHEHRNPKEEFVIVDSIRRFKGLESKIVILYDPPYSHYDDDVETLALLYTAISRCFCYLIIVSTKDGCKAIKKRLDEIKYRIEDKEDGVVSEEWD